MSIAITPVGGERHPRSPLGRQARRSRPMR